MEAKISESAEKLISHERINKLLFPWIERNKNTQGKIITMPANSGRHENLILEKIRYSELELLTFDWDFLAHETGISSLDGAKWTHQKGDIFLGLENLRIGGPCAAWFDLCGGLTNKNKAGLRMAGEKFSRGSLIFVTLAVHAVRSLGNDSTSKEVYECASNVSSKVILTDAMLQITLANPKKVLEYVYRRTSTVYALLGYKQ